LGSNRRALPGAWLSVPLPNCYAQVIIATRERHIARMIFNQAIRQKHARCLGFDGESGERAALSGDAAFSARAHSRQNGR
jgi:hypothetical protein